MKKSLFLIRKNILTLGAFVLMAVVFVACSKNDGDGTPVPGSGLMAFNLAPDQSAIGIALSGSRLTNTPLDFTNYTGRYLNIYVGNRTAQSYDYIRDSTIASVDYTFEPNEYYSLFVVGNGGSYKNIIVNDDIDSLSSASGEAYIRYINAIPDSSVPVVSISSNGSDMVNGPAQFSRVSGFVAVSSGEITIAVNNGGTINTSRTITVESGNVYTALLIGVPGATDSASAVQIKYIQNGTLADENGE